MDLTNVRRHNYDKPWRCPGWSGGGLSTPRPSRDICNGGSFAPHWGKGCGWHFHACPECGTVAIPHVTRWLDPTYYWYIKFRDWRWALRDWHEDRVRARGWVCGCAEWPCKMRRWYLRVTLRG